ncbi:trehalose/maltose transport system permease protein MalF [Halolamina pelagica]|uniref:Trehalose/maltose transport system permease protein MalF n=1 Tax=Halolamina pelagica TaxID=699431 RepID=A0A0P7H918_9EURY|nr:sugar ABC transporter permease [Halolamina pelagica]KPN30002.1 trehalose/maltose transport system permease protein MalF [Halolamina pelagica]
MAAEEVGQAPHGEGVVGQLSDWVNDHIRTVLLGPSLVALFVVFIYPATMLLWLSLQNTRGIGETFEPAYNYGRIFSDPTFWNAVEKTLIYSTGSLVLSVGAGLAIALALNKVLDSRVRNTYSTLILISWAVPLSIVGVTWRWMFNGQLGVVNKLLIDLGILQSSYSWLGNSLSAMVVVILADSWSRIPFAAVVLLAGLQSIPQEMYDAAKMDGATTLQTFRHVTLPYLRPSFFVAGLITWMFAFRAFAIPFSTTGGGPGGATETLAVYIHRFGIQLLDYGFASAVSVFLVGVTLIVATGYVYFVLEQIEEIEV